MNLIQEKQTFLMTGRPSLINNDLIQKFEENICADRHLMISK